MAETPFEQAARHVASLEKVIKQQEAIMDALRAMGDRKGLSLAKDLMKTFRHSLDLAIEHRDRLARRK